MINFRAARGLHDPGRLIHDRARYVHGLGRRPHDVARHAHTLGRHVGEWPRGRFGKNTSSFQDVGEATTRVN